MDVTKVLEADHRTVEDLFASLASGAPRPELAARICAEIELHSRIEEEVLYPDLETLAISERIRDSWREHDEIARQIAFVRRSPPGSRGFEHALRALEAVFCHHVIAEEHEVFPVAREELGPEILEKAAEEARNRRAELDPLAPAPAPTPALG